MKKTLFLAAIFLVALSVSACTLSKTGPDNKEAVMPLDNISDENKNLVDDQKVVTPTTETTAATDSLEQTTVPPVNTNNNMIDPSKFTDLAKEYSQALIKTSLGNITVKFYAEDAPYTVNNFLNLAQAGFYNGIKFHRVIKDFMIQGGDPLSKGTDTSIYGTGGPGYRFKDEFNTHQLVLGSLAMANSGPNTNGSQFFIVTTEATPWLDGKHTNFGEVVGGLDIVKKIGNVATGVNDLPTTDVVINSIELLK
ncbi:MAG: peptidylprolyl isomerase [Patescibacteria group bacterium]